MDNDTYCEGTLHFFGAEDRIPVSVNVRDGRAHPELSFEDNGIELVSLPTAVSDWQDEDDLATHYNEVEAFVRERFGCDWVLFYPALVRNPEAAAQNEQLGPIEGVHSDYTEAYHEMISDENHPYRTNILAPFMERAGITGADISSASRVVTVQFWRNIGQPEMDYPLVLADGATFDRSELMDILVAEYGGVETGFYSLIVLPPADESRHRWYTFPRLNHDEAIMFRAYDSALVNAGKPFWTPHSAFRDPTLPDAPPRASVEMRAICGFR